MAIEELKQEKRKLRVPTPERPVYMRYKSKPSLVVAFTGPGHGFNVTAVDSTTPGQERNALCRFDSGMWEPVTFTPCEPEYEETELKLPFVRKWEDGSIVVFHSKGAEDGYFAGTALDGGNGYYHQSIDDILRYSPPVRITGPTRKPAKVRYPALYRWKDGGEGVYTTRDHGFIFRGNDSGVIVGSAERGNATLVTDHPDFPQPAGEWELPFAVSWYLGLLVAFQAVNDWQFNGVYVTGAHRGEVAEINYPASWKPATVGDLSPPLE